MKNVTFFKNVLDNVDEGVYFVDLNRKISYWNRGAEQISGYTTDNVLGSSCSDNILVHVDDKGNRLCKNGCPLACSMQDGSSRQTTVYMLHKNGHRVSVNVKVNPLVDIKGKTIGAIEIFRENSQELILKERLTTLEQLSLIDGLTEIGNRRFAQINLETKFGELRLRNWQFGLIFADIDGFKLVNDRLGHDMGDRALKFVARTMKESIRNLDSVFRWGGEEFLAIIARTDQIGLKDVAERLRLMVQSSELAVDNERLKVTISIGATLAHFEDNPETILKRVDSLMYKSKSAGKNRVTMD